MGEPISRTCTAHIRCSFRLLSLRVLLLQLSPGLWRSHRCRLEAEARLADACVGTLIDAVLGQLPPAETVQTTLQSIDGIMEGISALGRVRPRIMRVLECMAYSWCELRGIFLEARGTLERMRGFCA